MTAIGKYEKNMEIMTFAQQVVNFKKKKTKPRKISFTFSTVCAHCKKSNISMSNKLEDL